MRYISTLIKESLTMFPAVLLLGPRQIGKSTLAQQLVKENILQHYITLDDFSTLSSAHSDPDGFIESISAASALDEIQRVPDLMRALKKNIDNNRRKGRFLLTGSANILAHPHVSESLAGRIDVFILEGFSLAELRKSPQPKFCQILLQESVSSFKDFLIQSEKTAFSFNQEDLLDGIFWGGFPEVVLSKNTAFRERYFQAYQTTYIEKDVRDLARSIDIVQYGLLAKVLLTHSGQLLNIKNLSNDLGLDQRTIKRYIELMEITFQTIQLPPWHRSSLKRLIKTPKVYAKDSGLMSFMQRLHKKEEMPLAGCFGMLLETFFFSELRKQTQIIPGVMHSFYRTHQGKEVDFVLEYGNKLVGIELKASSSVNAKDFSGLKDLQAANKDSLDFGIVFYQGNNVVYFGENLAAIPIKYLLFF